MKKTVIIIIALILAAVSVSLWILITPKQALPEFFQQFKTGELEPVKSNNSEYNPVEKTILYHKADFSENIYDDAVYLELLGPYVMHYKKDDIEVSVTESDLEHHGIWAEFFHEYIETVKNGDHTTYNSYFFDEYYDTHQKMNEFTMQKIYDLRVEELDVNVNLDEKEYAWVSGNGLEPVCFNVKYKIRQNNGTFRMGVSSDTYQSQLYILALDSKDNIKIIDIVAYSSAN